MKFENGIPVNLFKYRGFEKPYEKDLLYKQELFWTPPVLFNDPFDCAIPIRYFPDELKQKGLLLRKFYEVLNKKKPELTHQQLVEECIKNIEEGFVPDGEYMETVSKDLIDNTQSSLGVISFTTDSINYLMWSHYANCHTGYCIGFRTESLIKLLQCRPLPVTYFQYIPYFKMFEDDADFVMKFCCSKSKMWEAESEYRFLKQQAAGTKVYYDLHIIDNIYLGCKMSQENKEQILNFVSKNKMDHCQVFQATLSYNDFNLHFSQIK